MSPGRTMRGRLAALAGRLRPDRNPLRRRVDRIEAVLLALIIAAFAAGAPLAALAGGGWAAAVTGSVQRAEAGWQPVSARVLQTAAAAPRGLYQAAPDRLTEATWLAPDGRRQVGRIGVPGGVRSGQSVTIWVNRAGRVVGYPVQHADVVIRSLLAGAAAVLLLAAALGIIALLVRRLLDRRRLAAWDMSWAVTGPQWTGRR